MTNFEITDDIDFVAPSKWGALFDAIKTGYTVKVPLADMAPATAYTLAKRRGIKITTMCRDEFVYIKLAATQ